MTDFKTLTAETLAPLVADWGLTPTDIVGVEEEDVEYVFVTFLTEEDGDSESSGRWVASFRKDTGACEEVLDEAEFG